MSAFRHFELRAGPTAFARIREQGFRLDDVDTLLGAAGGPKWLVLSGLDRLLAPALFAQRARPLHLIGASISSWRFACYAQPDPVAAINAFEHHYIEQQYSEKPSLAEVDAGVKGVLDAFLKAGGGPAMPLEHPTARLGVLAVRSRGLTRPEARPLLAAGMVASISANLVARRGAGLMFRQTVFHDPRHAAPIEKRRGLPIDRTPLSAENIHGALMASSSIPGLMSGVDDPPGARRGRYRDGGLVDYHLDLPVADEGGLVFQPHFFDRVVPGWFDQSIPWRKAKYLDRRVLLYPSADFVQKLPHGRIPSRKDFSELGNADRIKAWWKVTEAANALGEEVMEAMASGALAQGVMPFGS
ncbi:MAG: patatin-like phospholipase family protein [Bradymonadia bacterium]